MNVVTVHKKKMEVSYLSRFAESKKDYLRQANTSFNKTLDTMIKELKKED